MEMQAAAPAAAAMTERNGVPSKPGVGYDPPRGAWKDGLCACCNQLVPTCAIATCCPCIGLALVSQRLGWSGRVVVGSGSARPCACSCDPAPSQHYRRTMCRFLGTLGAVLLAFGLTFAFRDPEKESVMEWYHSMFIIAGSLIIVDLVVFLAELRGQARRRLLLPPVCSGDADPSSRCLLRPFAAAFVGDACVSWFCFPLVLAQLLRHLFDFRGPCDGRCPLSERDAETLV